MPNLDPVICQICPNGCPLKVVPHTGGSGLLKGNRCPKGVIYAQFFYKDAFPNGLEENLDNPDYQDNYLISLLRAWGIQDCSPDKKVWIQGSPERSVFRSAMIGTDSSFLLELFPPVEREKKRNIALRLHELKSHGFKVNPPIKTMEGEIFHMDANGVWQLSPLLKGEPLSRIDFWKNRAMGANLGDFLVDLAGYDKPFSHDGAFNLPEFIVDLISKIRQNQPWMMDKLEPVLAYLEEHYFPHHSHFPLVLGHGDPHPHNILWRNREVLSVIDWEFSGAKPILYDASLVMGCVGSEDPQALWGGFNRGVLSRLKESSLFKPWLEHLPAAIIAQRFAWLNEWLRHDDVDMQEQELVYMHIIIDGIGDFSL